LVIRSQVSKFLVVASIKSRDVTDHVTVRPPVGSFLALLTYWWPFQAVADVKSAGVDVSLEIQDVRQRYELLVRYKHRVSPNELRQLRGLDRLWSSVREKSHYTNFKLVTVKSKFTSLAQLEIKEFAEQIRKVS